MWNTFRKSLYITLSISTAGFVNSAYAQNTVPSTADPGIIIQDIEEPKRPVSRLEESLSIKEGALEDNLSTDEIFTLQGVSLEGSSVYTQEQVNAILQDYLGQPTSFADLNAMTLRLTRQYRADGYMFSRAFLPPQEVDEGIVRFTALEGRLTEVEVVGDYKDDNNLIRDLAAKLESEGPTNQDDLERYLLLIDDLPGIRARSVLQPSETPGGGKLVVTIEQDPFEGSASLDNRGSKLLGRGRVTGVAAFNSLFGIHDRTTVRGIVTTDVDELKFFDITHEEQLFTEGTRLKGRFAATSTNPGKNLDVLGVEGESRLFDAEVLHPLIRSRQYNLNLIGGFTMLNSESDILGIEVSKDKVRYLRAGANFDFTDQWAGVTQLGLEFSQGIDIFGATNDGLGRTRANGEHDFFRTNVSVVRLQDLPGNFSMQLSGEAQHSADPLLASEEFSIGGGAYGRAYDSGEITGDQGAAAALELRYGGPVPNDFINSYQFYTYYDVGKVWNESPLVTESSAESLASAGVGVRFNLDYDVSGYMELNKPLTRDISAEGDDDSRIFFSLLKRF